MNIFNLNKASVVVIGIIIAAILGLAAWGTYILVKPSPKELPEGEEVVEEEEPLPEEKDEFASWKTYRNEEYGFEFKYPEDWTANENYLKAKEKEMLYLVVTNESAPTKMIVYSKACIDAGAEAYSGTTKPNPLHLQIP